MRRPRARLHILPGNAAAPDRCVWATDWSHPNASFISNDGNLVDLLADWIPDKALRARGVVDNPAQLNGFQGGLTPIEDGRRNTEDRGGQRIRVSAL